MASQQQQSQSHAPGPGDDDTPSTSTSTSTSALAIAIAVPSSYGYFPPISAYPTPQNSQPPSPNGIHAAAILAALSDSRPPTSHAEDADGGLFDDDDTGGILLPNEADDFTPYIPHPSAIPAALSQWMMEQGVHLSLDQHAAALEALSMDQIPTPPTSTPAPTQTETLAPPPPPTSTQQDWAPMVTNDEHLSIQDPGAFIDIANFLQYYAQLPKGGLLLPLLDVAVQPPVVMRENLEGDKCDFQGIDWSERISRPYVRQNRANFERARLQHRVHDGHGLTHRHQLRHRHDFFSFRRMNTTHQPHCPHFQLRNVMTATSRNDIFYTTKDALLRTDAQGSPATRLVDLNRQKVNGHKSQITTLAAQNNVLVAGGFEGDYMIADLTSNFDTPVHFGQIKDWAPDAKSYIANHVHLFNSRTSYTPHAAICSNDSRFRILDCMTDTFISTFAYPSAVNCSATSPDGRMRVVVGDFQETYITNAETGQPFEVLSAHVDDAFACAWADDGIHIATAAQDSTIVVWDARYWQTPVAVMPSELSIPRTLRFSPVGGGPRVLVAAEADDYVNIIDAQTWDSKQVFDFFGPTAGISFTPDGQSLFVANSEQKFGGLIELERSGSAGVYGGSGSSSSSSFFDTDEGVDWIRDVDLQDDGRVVRNWSARSRGALDLGSLVV